MSCEKEIEFFKRLVDGAENSNHSAECAIKSAYSSLHPSASMDTLIDDHLTLRAALTGLIEKYEEIVCDETVGRSLEDIDLVTAKRALELKQ